MLTVTLFPAFGWTCPACDRHHVEESVIAEIGPDERREMLEAGIDGEQAKSGNWMTAPEEVTCVGCGQTFKANDGREA